MSDQAPDQIGKYRIEGELGKGGMATVYGAVDPVIQRPIAIKVVRRSEIGTAEGATLLRRFKREAQAAGALNHPNIVSIYEYGEDDQFAWIVMERVDGRTLRDHLRDGYRADPGELPRVIEQLLEALDYSHAQGIIHRDVKPGNVLITRMGIAKISDFGIARIEKSNVTQVGSVLGTPYYMAPEQYMGEPATNRTDIYAAGVLVYEMYCGRRPFIDQGAALMTQVLEDPPTPPSSLEPRLPSALDEVLGKALAKRPEDRYASAGDFLMALRRVFDTKTGKAIAEAAKSETELKASGARIAGNVGALRRALASTESVKPHASAPAAAMKKPFVLCVDDEERVLSAISLILSDHFDVSTATSAAEALELIKGQRFHVIVSDQRMPGMTGVELLREAKTASPSSVRILLTGYSDLTAIVGSVNESEVFRFLNKPWQTGDLIATITEAVDVAIALEAANARRAPIPRSEAAALVLGDTAMARATRELARGGFRVLEAPDTEEALRLLAVEEIGVFVFDLDTQGSDDPAALLKVLKEQAPATQLVVVSQASDSEMIISLINEARIHKFIKKPASISLLHQSVLGALDAYARMRASPEFARTQAAKHGKQSEKARSILSKLASLGGRFASVFRKPG